MEPLFAASSGIAALPERNAVLRPADALRPSHRPVRPAACAVVADGALWSALLGTPALGSAEIAALGAIALARQVTAGQSVLSRSASASTLVALRSGEVALGFRTVDGTFRTERIVRGPAWLDLSSAWLAGPHAMDAQAMGPASVVELPRDALEAHLAEHPGLAQRLIQGLAREVQALTVNTHELMHKDAPARLAQWLYQRCEPLAGESGQAVVKLSDRKRDVASQLAITPETLSRLMRSFTRQGVIEVSGYSVRVLDPAALGRLAQA
ncbi:MAG: Crp/Fnr family transcriptional regulator [Aquabacterium sp.]|nr:Crp/Fnr family transcriptional regulator [Aquabacterium sp.]